MKFILIGGIDATVAALQSNPGATDSTRGCCSKPHLPATITPMLHLYMTQANLDLQDTPVPVMQSHHQRTCTMEARSLHYNRILHGGGGV